MLFGNRIKLRPHRWPIGMRAMWVTLDRQAKIEEPYSPKLKVKYFSQTA
jgi:hypothetical protein